eukprot:COSAG02_NODE_130_length_34758_cov_80.817767_33_plen_165_part_00
MQRTPRTALNPAFLKSVSHKAYGRMPCVRPPIKHAARLRAPPSSSGGASCRPKGARPALSLRVPHRREQRRHGASPSVELRRRLLPLSLLEFACFEAAFSECLQFSEQSGRNCIEVAYWYRSVWHIQEKAGLPNDDIVTIWRDSLSVIGRFTEFSGAIPSFSKK